MPCETETPFSSSSSSREMAPALACGSSPVSSTTSLHIAARYSTVDA